MPTALLRAPRQLLSRSPLPSLLAKLDRRLDAADLAPGQSVLYLGCGDGLLAPALRERIQGGRLCLTDPHANLVERARARLGSAGEVDLKVCDPSDTGYPDGSFDRVLLHNVFHTLKDRGGTVREVRRLLVPGGKLWLWEPRGIVRRWQVESYEGMFLGARFVVEARPDGPAGFARVFAAVDDAPGSRFRP